MTAMEIAKTFSLQPKDVIAFIQANATFPVKRNFQTGEISIPDDIDIKAFIMPLLNKEQSDKIEQEKRQATEKLRKEQQEAEVLKKTGAEGYYQYDVISLVDEKGGFIEPTQLTAKLNALGKQGWRLVAAYSNEIGHNSSSSGFGGYSSGTNATVDQNILIFERFVKI